jgi:hypothetical protein
MKSKAVEQQTHLRLPAQLSLGLGWIAEELLHLCGTIELRVNLHPAETEFIAFHWKNVLVVQTQAFSALQNAVKYL